MQANVFTQGINKKSLTTVFDLLFFVLSCVNRYLLIAWLLWIVVSKVFIYKTEGAIEAFILIQLRSIINPGVSVEINQASIVKWLCVFALSIYIIVVNRYKLNLPTVKSIVLVCGFAVYCILASVMESSYPTVAMFKVISFAVPFIAIIFGVYATKETAWINKITFYFGVLILLSAVTIPLPVAYLRNGMSFQGLTNHPNMFGIITALYLAGIFYKQNRKFTFFTGVIFVLCIAMLWLSKSRTGMATSIILFFIYILFSDLAGIKKAIIISFMIIFGMIAFLYAGDTIVKYISEFIYKGGDGILNSRLGQIDNNWSRFIQSPFFGTGFNVPYIEGIRSYEFSFDLITENGNLIMALLGDAGVFGLLLFIVCYGYILCNGSGIYLFIAPILVSLGEMTFFSTNNIGILLYMYFAIYLANGKNRNENSLRI